MKRVRILIIVIAGMFLIALVASLARPWTRKPVPEGAPTPPPQGAEWVDLLDEAHAGGWKNITDGCNLFEVKEGALHIFGATPPPLRYAGYTTEPFGDFELHIEFKVTRHANSGVFLRVPVGPSPHRGFEIQVLDDYGHLPHKNGCGAIYDVVTPMFNMSRPAGEWNSYDITVRGGEVTVLMNGWMIIHTDLAQMTRPLGKYKVPFSELPGEGQITLQDHGGEVWYRNIRVRKIDAQ